jgi:hypothetical protein
MIPPRECAAKMMRTLGMVPDPWQLDVLPMSLIQDPDLWDRPEVRTRF